MLWTGYFGALQYQRAPPPPSRLPNVRHADEQTAIANTIHAHTKLRLSRPYHIVIGRRRINTTPLRCARRVPGAGDPGATSHGSPLPVS
eukprot:5306236-Prymnesium_polylepis.1